MDEFGPRWDGDVLDYVDQIRSERKYTVTCGVCGNSDPVRVERAGCDACVGFPKCWLCGRWIDTPDAPPSSVVSVDGELVTICDPCWEKTT
jgi:hypothetical protein